MAAVTKINGSLYSVFNIDVMEDFGRVSEQKQTNFDTETVDGRLARREKTWTPASLDLRRLQRL